MPKPVIGITADVKASDDDLRSPSTFSVKSNYVDAIAAAGGTPMLVPPGADPDEVLEILDGLLIPGGDDIDPKHFGQELHPKAELQHPMRFDAEAKLYRKAPPTLPILGICYGCQFINVLQGGSLTQHLPDIDGAAVHTGGPIQQYRLEEGSKIATAVRANVAEGRSYHHQAVLEPGDNVAITGYSEDGTVEALEVTDRSWTVAVQWHPERTLDNAGMQHLFRTFVEQAAKYAGAKRGH